VDPIDLCFAGAAQQAQLIRDGEVSARELIDATLRRIDELNPRLNAYRVVFAEQAIEQAAGIDARPRDERALALLGVPVAIKDDTDVAGELTAWGTSAPGQAKPNDADVVARLRSAGAIIIGKTHVSEMTAWPWTSSKAWGVTRNPWDPDRTPGGSSGGSATATAAGMCGVALGSDGGGSVRYPAALTGLFGLKPQRDRIPLGVQHADGWHGLLTYGSLSRTVADAALFLDAAANPTPSGQFADGLHLPIGALRVAVSFDPPAGSMVRLTAERRLAVERVAKVLDELGHHVIEREIRYTARAMRNTTIRYLAGVHQDVATMAHPDQLERNTRRVARLGSMVPSWLLARARRAEVDLASSINQIFDHADVVLTPITAGPPPHVDDVGHGGVVRSLLQSNNGAWAMPWNAIGQPAAAVPSGFDTAGLPVAVQLCGRRDDEMTLLRLARQIETAAPWADARPRC